jgi:hypothetical protein
VQLKQKATGRNMPGATGGEPLAGLLGGIDAMVA